MCIFNNSNKNRREITSELKQADYVKKPVARHVWASLYTKWQMVIVLLISIPLAPQEAAEGSTIAPIRRRQYEFCTLRQVPLHCDSINPATMKSRGADVETRANLPVYTISSYTEALAPAPPSPHTCLQKCSCWTKWLYHLGLLFHLCCCFSWSPVSSRVTPNSGAVWKMEEGNHAKWTYSPACRKITEGWTISHLPTELQISCICTKRRSEKNPTKPKNDTRRK